MPFSVHKRLVQNRSLPEAVNTMGTEFSFAYKSTEKNRTWPLVVIGALVALILYLMNLRGGSLLAWLQIN